MFAFRALLAVAALSDANFSFVQLWGKEYPDAAKEEKVSFVPVDFLKEPPVLGCDFYYVRLSQFCVREDSTRAIECHFRRSRSATACKSGSSELA